MTGQYGTMTLIDTTIAGNATVPGSGVYAGNPAGSGGGIFELSGTVTVSDCTIADNSAAVYGGGLWVDTGTATLDNTIVALNNTDISGGVSSSSAYNLIGTGGSGGLVNGVNGNQVGVADPGLGTLADNGGPTQTIALLPGSPAIDAGSNALAVDPTTGLPLVYDQRGPGFPRIVNGTVDIGAFEYEPPVSVTAITDVSPDPRNSTVSVVDVTFSRPINPSSLTSGALTLTDNGSANLIESGVTLTLVSGSTYAIGDLTGLTGAEGNYTLTVNAADILDPNGVAGTGTSSTAWLMDTTPPTSHVNALAARGTSLSFSVSVTGSDGGNPPSGVASYEIYASINGGAWSLWTTVPASNATATYTGQSNTTYSFYSVAHDLAGNTENQTPLIEASTYLPDLTPPVTAVDGTSGTNPSTVNTTTGTFTLNVTGSDPGGGIVTDFEVFVSVDSGAYTMVNGTAIPAGPPSSQGITDATIAYQGLTDGSPHQYAFYSIGIDSAGNIQSAPLTPNLSLTETFAQPSALQVTNLIVEDGAVERSYIRYLDVGFNESDSQSGGELAQIANSVGTASPQIQLYKYDLNDDASSKTAVSLSGVSVAVIDHAIELDFGGNGLGGSPNTTAADGYYELDINLPNGTTAVHHLYRLLGDVTGDGVVDNNDLNAIAEAIGLTSPSGLAPLGADVNGDGTISALDLLLATRSKGHKLKSGLSLG